MPIPPPAQPPAVLRIAGPPTPLVKGIHRSSGTFTQTQAVAAAMGEMAGAVVVVEGEAPAPLPKVPMTLRVPGLSIRILQPFGSWGADHRGYGPLFVDGSGCLAMRGGYQTSSAPLGWGFN